MADLISPKGDYDTSIYVDNIYNTIPWDWEFDQSVDTDVESFTIALSKGIEPSEANEWVSSIQLTPQQFIDKQWPFGGPRLTNLEADSVYYWDIMYSVDGEEFWENAETFTFPPNPISEPEEVEDDDDGAGAFGGELPVDTAALDADAKAAADLQAMAENPITAQNQVTGGGKIIKDTIEKITGMTDVGGLLKKQVYDLKSKLDQGEDITSELEPMLELIEASEETMKTVKDIESAISTGQEVLKVITTVQKGISVIPSVGPTGPVASSVAVLSNLLREEAQKIIEKIKVLPSTIKKGVAGLKEDIKEVKEVIKKHLSTPVPKTGVMKYSNWWGILYQTQNKPEYKKTFRDNVRLVIEDSQNDYTVYPNAKSIDEEVKAFMKAKLFDDKIKNAKITLVDFSYLLRATAYHESIGGKYKRQQAKGGGDGPLPKFDEDKPTRMDNLIDPKETSDKKEIKENETNVYLEKKKSAAASWWQVEYRSARDIISWRQEVTGSINEKVKYEWRTPNTRFWTTAVTNYVGKSATDLNNMTDKDLYFLLVDNPKVAVTFAAAIYLNSIIGRNKNFKDVVGESEFGTTGDEKAASYAEPETFEFMDYGLSTVASDETRVDFNEEIPRLNEESHALSIIRKTFVKEPETAINSQSPTQIASSFLGYSENDPKQNEVIAAFIKKHTPFDISPADTAWCAAFINAVLGAGGKTGTDKLNARSFLDWGNKVEEADAELGDIVVFWRVARDSWQGHVGLYMGKDKDGNIKVLGGNQNNEVSESVYGKERLLGFRRGMPDA